MRPASRSAFSLIELLIVLTIAALLMGLLMPSFMHIRESARQAACASNLHQVGIALSLYMDGYGERLPPSHFNGDTRNKTPARPQEMMAAYVGRHALPRTPAWEAMGWLIPTRLLNSPDVFYCPSHTGSHPIDRYIDEWANPGQNMIEINYHYRFKIGDTIQAEWNRDVLSRLYPEQPIFADGMRTKKDFNHVVGANILRVDSVVRWFDDSNQQVYKRLPETADEMGWTKDPWPLFSSKSN